jgi:hypothetical protein
MLILRRNIARELTCCCISPNTHDRDICNMVFELSECMHSATWAAYEELLYVIKFTSDTKSFGLKVEPKTHKNIKWNLNFFCDSDWAGDPETRVRITGFIIYL